MSGGSGYECSRADAGPDPPAATQAAASDGGAVILFFPEQSPHALKRVTIQKTEPVLADLERAAGRSVLAQAKQVGAHFFLAELVRRTSVMRRQPPYCLDVDCLRPGSQPSQGHVLDHRARNGDMVVSFR